MSRNGAGGRACTSYSACFLCRCALYICPFDSTLLSGLTAQARGEFWAFRCHDGATELGRGYLDKRVTCCPRSWRVGLRRGTTECVFSNRRNCNLYMILLKCTNERSIQLTQYTRAYNTFSLLFLIVCSDVRSPASRLLGRVCETGGGHPDGSTAQSRHHRREGLRGTVGAEYTRGVAVFTVDFSATFSNEGRVYRYFAFEFQNELDCWLCCCDDVNQRNRQFHFIHAFSDRRRYTFFCARSVFRV